MTKPTTYRILPVESHVTFLGESSVHPIEASVEPRGWYTALVTPDGFVEGEAAGHIEIPITELSSGNPLIDRETKRRTDAKQYPTITGDLTGVLSVEGKEADIEGRISFRGEAVDVEGRIELSEITSGRIVLEGEGVFDVRWWGLEPPKLLMLKVYPELTVRIRLVMEAE
jgi:polyisoprenoid-binding protein YceI